MIQTQRGVGAEALMPAARDVGTKKPLQGGGALQGFLKWLRD
jgi:hypothetical protein